MDEKLCKIIEALEDQTGLKIQEFQDKYNCWELRFKTPKGGHIIHTLYVCNDDWGWHVYQQRFDLTAKNLLDKIVVGLE
jgi:hypothetical protein